MRTFLLPDLGEGLHDAEIVSWHVSVGDHVVADQPLISVETEKAVVEVPAPWSGRIAKLYGEVGDLIETGAALVDIESPEVSEDAGAVVGKLEVASEDKKKMEQVPVRTTDRPARIRISPAVRALAHEKGIEPSQVQGTGPGGAITRLDIENASQLSIPSGYEAIKGVRRSMARNMSRAHAEVVPTTVTDEANITHWNDLHEVTIRLIRAMVAACKAEPALNAWFDGKSMSRQLHSGIRPGIAVDSEDGLFAPVLENAESKTTEELKADLSSIKEAIKERSIDPARLKGQTITLSNFGMMGGCHAALVVVPPQVAIVGAGRVRSLPRVVSGNIEACKVLPLSLTFDHRAVTGAEATRFLMAIISDLERD